jgi:hypothetical protein
MVNWLGHFRGLSADAWIHAMTYRKGELSSSSVDRGWPHQIALRADHVMRDFQIIAEFCRDLSLCVRGHSVNDGRDWYRVYCFAEADDADKFIERFGGQKFDPVQRGRGRRWAQWKR